MGAAHSSKGWLPMHPRRGPATSDILSVRRSLSRNGHGWSGPTADFGVVGPHRMMRTDTVRPKGLLDHSYMHGSCGSISAQYAVKAARLNLWPPSFGELFTGEVVRTMEYLHLASEKSILLLHLLGDSVNRVKNPLEGLLSGLPLTFLRGLLP